MSIFSKLFSGKKSEPFTVVNLEYSSSFSAFGGNNYENAAFRAAVDTIARHAAKLKAHSPNAAIEKLLSVAPNPYITAYDMLYRLTTALLVNNNAFMLIERTGGVISAFHVITPTSAEFFEDYNKQLFVKFTFADGKQRTYSYNDVIHIKRHYAKAELLGQDNTPLYAILDTAETLNQGITAATKNAVNLKGILKFTQLLNPTQQKTEKEIFVKDYYNTANNGGIATTDNRYEFIPVNNTPYNVPTETINAVNRQIYNYLGVSEKIISGEYTENEFGAFYESIIEPFALQLSLEATRKSGEDVIFTSERLEFSSADTRISLLRYAAPLGVFTKDECRKLLALPPLEDRAEGKKVLQSLNYVNAAKADRYQNTEESEVIS
jgi:HK97 family phage portal protein